ncbi:hypothetical protein D1643_09845, partial [Enterorhabdus sp. P55]|nr:hypothetical protein [Enterorhabdus sp. P55]
MGNRIARGIQLEVARQPLEGVDALGVGGGRLGPQGRRRHRRLGRGRAVGNVAHRGARALRQRDDRHRRQRRPRRHGLAAAVAVARAVTRAVARAVRVTGAGIAVASAIRTR